MSDKTVNCIAAVLIIAAAAVLLIVSFHAENTGMITGGSIILIFVGILFILTGPLESDE